MRCRMKLVALIAAVMGVSMVLAATAQAQLFRQTVPQQIYRPVFGPKMGAINGPGPGVLAPSGGYGANYGATAQGQVPNIGMRQLPTSQLYFIGPEEMSVSWDVFMPNSFDSEPRPVPFAQNFMQGAIYRLKLSDVPARDPEKIYYPTIEVAATMARSQAFLAHNSIPIEFTDNDFDQVDSGNFVTKVIYLPDPEFQGLAMAGVGTLVNTQLEPGADPIVEADNRGSILAIIRLGNKDLTVADMPGSFDMGMPGPIGVGIHGSAPQNYISGVNAPEYGIPRTKTNVGVNGPAYLPSTGQSRVINAAPRAQQIP